VKEALKNDIRRMAVQSQLWSGLQLKDMMDRIEEGTKLDIGPSNKQKVSVEMIPTPESAFLGPKLWDKPISLQEFNEDDFFVMNIDDFLAENDLQKDKDKFGKALKENEKSPEPDEMRCTNPNILALKPESPMDVLSSPSPRPGVIVSTKDCKRNLLPKGENTFLYAESKRARMEREKEEKLRALEISMDFAPEDLALATVPGADFDPKERSFDVEELRPQPIIRKRPKQYVPDLEKDDKYWDKRGKNNVAARRSREARRLKENQIALRAAYLERENSVLKQNLDDANFTNSKLGMELEILKKKLAKYE